MGLSDGMAWERENGHWDTPPTQNLKLLEAVQKIVEVPDKEFTVFGSDGKKVGVLYWDDFNDRISINKQGLRDALGTTLKELKIYNEYTCKEN